MPNANELTVPEYNVANPDGGAERLDADTPSQSDLDVIDSALDAAEAASASDDTNDFSRNIGEQNSDDTQPARNADGTFAKPDATADPAQDPAAQQQQQPADLDPEIAAIDMPPNMSEKQQSNWRKLTTKANESAVAARKYAAELETLRQKVAEQEKTRQLPEDYEELRQFRATFDLKNDPEFKLKYDKPMKDLSDNIYSLLKKHKASDEIIKAIQDTGGPHKVEKAWWKRNIIDKLAASEDGFVDAQRINNALAGIEDIESNREKDLELSTQKQQEWMEQRQKESYERTVKDVEAVNRYVETITKDHPWARYQEIPANATPEQIQKIQAHNARVDDLSDKFRSAYNAKSAEERAAVTTAAVMSHVLVDQLKIEQASRAQMQKQIEALMKENSMLKQSGRMPKSSIQGQTPAKSSLSDRIKMDSAAAIDLGLDEAGA